MRNQRSRARAASIASSVLILVIGLVPAANAADHLDSPTVSAKGAVDITDLYTFSAGGGTRTVFIVGVNPGAGVLPTSGTTFGHNVDYFIKIDRNGDLLPDTRFRFNFGRADGSGDQSYRLWRDSELIATGHTGATTRLGGGGRVTAGLFDDPFFFDLDAFKAVVLGSGSGREFCDAETNDFFLGLNINALVLRVPNSWLGGSGKNLGVWASTEAPRGGQHQQVDMMGRPAINTVFNNASDQKTDRELFNRAQPREQVRLGFRDHAADVLTALGGDPALADVLIPDVMTYQTGNMAGFLNGRRLADDVIDAELNLVTNGGITTDCIDNDSAFPGAWPFLAPAN